VEQGNESEISGIILRKQTPHNTGSSSGITNFTVMTTTMKRNVGFAVAGTLAMLLGAAAEAQTPAGDAAAGRQKNSMCIGCHGIDGYKTAFPEVYNVPKIGGQHPAYMVKALQAYKSGERNHPSMKGIAATLSDKDMADLAAYYSAGPGKVAAK
jgi:cytochrome c553